jgi:hypothetical protein
MRRVPSFLVVVALLLALASGGQAAVAVDVGGFSAQGDNFQGVIGWEFEALESIRVTHLGMFDASESTGGWGTDTNPDSTAIQVGIFTTGATPSLVLQAEIIAQDLVANTFVYTPLDLSLGSQLVLAPGVYRIAALVSPTVLFRYSPTSGPIVAPEIALRGAYFDEAFALQSPLTADPSSDPGYFGPNFQYDLSITASSVPEPGSVALMGLGLCFVALRFCRR